MKNVIIILMLVALVGAASFYIWKAKKSGKKCIGCPSSGCSKCTCKNK